MAKDSKIQAEDAKLDKKLGIKVGSKKDDRVHKAMGIATVKAPMKGKK